MRLAIDVCLLHDVLYLGLDSIGFLLSQSSISNQLLFIDLSNWSHLTNNLVHEGLCERGLIKLIVTSFSVADQVNDDVLLEFSFIVSCDSENLDHILNAISIDVEDWSINDLSNVCAISATSSLVRVCGESNLIVDHNVD